jgi:hypothetical protein
LTPQAGAHCPAPDAVIECGFAAHVFLMPPVIISRRAVTPL